MQNRDTIADVLHVGQQVAAHQHRLSLGLQSQNQIFDFAGADRIEASGEAFLQRVVAGFAALAGERGWRRLDASQSPEQVAATCRTLLANLP